MASGVLPDSMTCRRQVPTWREGVPIIVLWNMALSRITEPCVTLRNAHFYLLLLSLSDYYYLQLNGQDRVWDTHTTGGQGVCVSKGCRSPRNCCRHAGQGVGVKVIRGTPAWVGQHHRKGFHLRTLSAKTKGDFFLFRGEIFNFSDSKRGQHHRE